MLQVAAGFTGHSHAPDRFEAPCHEPIGCPADVPRETTLRRIGNALFRRSPAEGSEKKVAIIVSNLNHVSAPTRKTVRGKTLTLCRIF